MQLKKFCNNCKKTTTHEPDASLLITNYGNKSNVSWQCRRCYPNTVDKSTTKNVQ